MIYGVDAVHGHGNVYGATIFPHNIGLGATARPGAGREVGAVTAAEVRATGIPWDFAPCICVSRDARWGRTYESFGEDPALVSRMETIIDGLQGRGRPDLDRDHVLATAEALRRRRRHPVRAARRRQRQPAVVRADYTIDQGITITNRADFDRIDLAPYERRSAGRRRQRHAVVLQRRLDRGRRRQPDQDAREPGADHRRAQGRMGFDGFVISDWEGIHQIPSGDPPTAPTPYKVRIGVNAGIDMFMEPNTCAEFVTTLLAEVDAGRVSRARIDDAVRRILDEEVRARALRAPVRRPPTSARSVPPPTAPSPGRPSPSRRCC